MKKNKIHQYLMDFLRDFFKILKNWKNLSTLVLYCIVNKTIINVVLVTIQKPLTRPFQNTHY